MDTTILNDWLHIAGLFAVVGSMLFVGLAVRKSKQISLESPVQRDASLIIEHEGQVAAKPDVWMRGCLGEDLSAVDQVRFTHLYQPYESLY